jgi:hypothetical protein
LRFYIWFCLPKSLPCLLSAVLARYQPSRRGSLANSNFAVNNNLTFPSRILLSICFFRQRRRTCTHQLPIKSELGIKEDLMCNL